MMKVSDDKAQAVFLLQSPQDVEEADRIQPTADPYDHGVTVHHHVVTKQRAPYRRQDFGTDSLFTSGHAGDPP
jgi:hypothetical protein